MKSILLFGGSSDERLVSVASAQNLSRQYAFDEMWYWHLKGPLHLVSKEELAAHTRPFEMEFSPRLGAFANSLEVALPQLKDKVVFIGLHGTQGEDGSLQMFFEKNKIHFTGSGAVSSHQCFDKIKAKEILRRAGLPLADEMILAGNEKKAWGAKLGEFFKKHGRLVAKPVLSGSSVGLQMIGTQEDLDRALKEMLSSQFNDYLLEKFLQGRELTVGVYEKGKKIFALPPSEVVLNQGFSFDYQGKYLGRGTTEITPAILTTEESQKAQELALNAHRTLGCFGYSRTDMILTNKGPYFLETNTLPGLSKASFIPQQLIAAEITVPDFINEQLKMAESRF